MTEAKDSKVCKITRADGSSSFHGDIQALLRRLDRQDLSQLYSLKMINLKIEAEEESTMAHELIKFIKSQIVEQSHTNAAVCAYCLQEGPTAYNLTPPNTQIPQPFSTYDVPAQVNLIDGSRIWNSNRLFGDTFLRVKRVYPYGAHVTSWNDEHNEEMIFLSSKNSNKEEVFKIRYGNRIEQKLLGNREELDSAYDRFQNIISMLELYDAKVSCEDANLKFLRSLPSVWHVVATMIRGQHGLDELDFDDLVIPKA
ncbi:hypothetical protein Tco_1474163 [Tanacetum coccineum]